MNTKKLIKEAHENAVAKGFYECPDCMPENPVTDKRVCARCNASGKHRDVDELLMLIITEMSEAVEAHRKGRFCPKEYRDPCSLSPIDLSLNYPPHIFESLFKDTFEDEMADVFIRLFDLCGYYRLKGLSYIDGKVIVFSKNIPGTLYNILKFLPCTDVNKIDFSISLNLFFTFMTQFCTCCNIDIENHIRLKMAYNKTRPIRHGKRY